MTGSLLAVTVAGLSIIKAAVQRQAAPVPAATRVQAQANFPILAYTVHKNVSEFPGVDDLSTPETAYATCNRISARGEQSAWRSVSCRRLAARLPAEMEKIEVSTTAARDWLTADILEVFVFEDRRAMVCARIPHSWKTIIDTRTFELEDGLWKNAGNDVVGSVERARERFERSCAWQVAEQKSRERAPVADPEKHLRPFIEFLEREGENPVEFMLRALGAHRVVVLGEVHNRARYWAFNTALVRSPEFVRKVGVIYLEFPFNDQALMGRFLAAPTDDPAPVIEMLRDMFELGWPDQPTVEFCQAVWEVNQDLPAERRIRIVLVDMARPWKEIQKRDDWGRYRADRDDLMAGNILRDLRAHAQDQRNALFIVGYMHALKQITLPDGTPQPTAGWHLSQALGASDVYAIFPHSPVMANRGDVRGRIALGLFESAFATQNNRPMSFPLDHGPFGGEVFDASLDLVTTSSFADGFDAYLYLGPLDDEIMSPLVPGFYTDEFAREADRRTRLMGGQGLREVTGDYLENLRGSFWGRPRQEWRELGPLDAWHHGSDWERKAREVSHRNALREAPAIQAAAQQLFNAIRLADYDNPGPWKLFPSPDAGYRVHSDYPGWMEWVCRRFRDHPITLVELGTVSIRADGCPQLPYTLTLRDGSTLKGSLPFEWNVRAQRWIGFEGLDWHRG